MSLFSYLKKQIFHDSNTRGKLDAVWCKIDIAEQMLKQMRIDQRSDYLREKLMNCKEMGVSGDRCCGEEIIVSLTSFGNRINEVCLAIESIMQGTIKPNRIILWLTEDEFGGMELPVSLKKQMKRGLEIDYCKDIRSYKKIIPAMRTHQDACVVTIDDDLMYGYDLLENLLRKHCECPNDVCACRVHRITLTSDGKPNSYMDWCLEQAVQEKSNLNFLTSGGGTLFPPHCFIDEFFNQDVFMKLCPFADDVWINAMIWMSDRQISKAYTHSRKGNDFLEIAIEQEYALKHENTNHLKCRNDVQIKAVFDKYNLYHYLSNAANNTVGSTKSKTLF